MTQRARTPLPAVVFVLAAGAFLMGTTAFVNHARAAGTPR